jgi:hypothetical protein
MDKLKQQQLHLLHIKMIIIMVMLAVQTDQLNLNWLMFPK